MIAGMGSCAVCGRSSDLIAGAVGVCLDCLRSDPKSVEYALSTHRRERARIGLPPEPPRGEGIKCGLCDSECVIPEGGLGYCGIMMNDNGKLINLAGCPESGLLEYYYDPIPTNCVAHWFCPASTGIGYPKWSARKGSELGYYNLSVFYGACNLDCLFCQNWFFRDLTISKRPLVNFRELIEASLRRPVTCVCFFGGDPSPQVSNALLVANELMRMGRIMRICWEMNGHLNQRTMVAVLNSSLRSGGIVKFDLKAWNPSVYLALTGRDIGSVYENAKLALKLSLERPEVPLFTASTLLVPGYVDEEEVRMIARFIASINPDTPYSLLAFHPSYLMTDLPNTSRKHAMEAFRAAKDEGLTRVHIGNPWLLTREDYQSR